MLKWCLSHSKTLTQLLIPAIPFTWLKSSYNHSLTRSHRSSMESGRQWKSQLWRHQRRSFLFIIHADDVKREIRVYTSRLLANQKQDSAPSVGHDTYVYIERKRVFGDMKLGFLAHPIASTAYIQTFELFLQIWKPVWKWITNWFFPGLCGRHNLWSKSIKQLCGFFGKWIN